LNCGWKTEQIKRRVVFGSVDTHHDPPIVFDRVPKVTYFLHFDQRVTLVFVKDASKFEDKLPSEGRGSWISRRGVQGCNSGADHGLQIEHLALPGDISFWSREPSDQVYFIIEMANGMRGSFLEHIGHKI
jgi:hypothetical protein